MEKLCTRCKNQLPLSCFGPHKKSKDKLQYYCRECHISIGKENRNKRKESGYDRKRQLKITYNLEWEDYLQLLKDQNYKCNICFNNLVEGRHNNKYFCICVDHCHTTNKVRGLLCVSCNTGLGAFKDNKDILKSAINYLESTKQC